MAEEVFVHQPSGMAFPPAIGDFKRAQIVRYDQAGLDMSAGYNFESPDSDSVATVYVYPAPSLRSFGSPAHVVQSARAKLCADEFQRRQREVMAFHPDARLVSEEAVGRPQAGPAVEGKKASYEFDAALRGRRQSLHSDLYVYCFVADKWAFEYRFTSERNPDSSARIAAFMKALVWTIPENPERP